MITSRAGAPHAERTLRSKLADDTGPGLIETPLRVSNWVGFVGSWAVLGSASALLFIGGRQLMGIDDACAPEGPYDIAVACEAGTGALVVVAAFSLTAAVLLGVCVGQGFGAPAHGFAWTALWGSLGAAIVSGAHVNEFAWAWHLTGVLLLLVAALPGVLVRLGWPRSVFGRRRVDGLSLAKLGLPVRDAVMIGVIAVAAAFVGALSATTLHSLLL